MEFWKRYGALAAALALAVVMFLPRPALAQICGAATEVNLIAAQNINIGTVVVSNDETNLYVQYNVTAQDWVMTDTKLEVDTDLADIPRAGNQNNPQCNPVPGQFEYPVDHGSGVMTYTYTIPLNSINGGVEPGDTIYVAAYADVEDTDTDEGAWGEGPRFCSHPTGQWAMYLTYIVQACTDGFRTQTQGGWGSECHGDNNGCYRNTHFAGCFPDGLTVGLDDNGGTWQSAHFTSSQAIEDFLPAGGTAAPLPQDYTDPTSTGAGILAGQAVALTLNVEFDVCDVDFGASEDNLKDLYVVYGDSPCLGMTVQEVLDEANNILGGEASDFSASDINDCASAINENYADGADNGYLGPTAP